MVLGGQEGWDQEWETGSKRQPWQAWGALHVKVDLKKVTPVGLSERPEARWALRPWLKQLAAGLCLLQWEGQERRWRVWDVLRQNSPLNCGVCLDPTYITAACEMVAEMVEALPSVLALGHKRNSDTPAFLTSVLRNIIISLARLPLVNSYTRVPPLVSVVTPWRKTKVNETHPQAPGQGPRG